MMNLKLHSCYALASAALVGLAACAGESTSPSKFLSPTSASFTVGAVTDNTPQVGVVKVCKTGNAGGSFDVSAVAVGASTGTVSGLNTLIATGECRIVAEDDGPDGVGSNVTISEDAAANTVSSVTGCVFIGGSPPVVDGNPCAFNPTDRFINHFHGYVVTFNNTFTPPPAGCTYTKGWYQNKNGAPTIVLTLDGRTPNEQRAIFAATPGQPGSVTWGTNNKPNNLLNLYQQLLAALNNGGAAGPQSVQDAIAAALAATGGSGLNITVVGSPDIGALITPLSNFNEGNVAGFPHCGDEILPH
jgi:hypothetical protein